MIHTGSPLGTSNRLMDVNALNVASAIYVSVSIREYVDQIESSKIISLMQQMKVYSTSATEKSDRDVLRESLVCALAESIKLMETEDEIREALSIVLENETELIEQLLKGGEEKSTGIQSRVLHQAHTGALMRADCGSNRDMETVRLRLSSNTIDLEKDESSLNEMPVPVPVRPPSPKPKFGILRNSEEYQARTLETAEGNNKESLYTPMRTLQEREPGGMTLRKRKPCKKKKPTTSHYGDSDDLQTVNITCCSMLKYYICGSGNKSPKKKRCQSILRNSDSSRKSAKSTQNTTTGTVKKQVRFEGCVCIHPNGKVTTVPLIDKSS